jgi:GTP-binding protein
VASGQVRLLAVLTKSDKLNRREGDAALATAQAMLSEMATETADIGVVLFSALSRRGLEDVAETVYGWAHPGQIPPKT